MDIEDQPGRNKTGRTFRAEKKEQHHIEAEKIKQSDENNMEEAFVYQNDKKFFEAICESYQTKLGNPAVCQAVVN